MRLMQWAVMLILFPLGASAESIDVAGKWLTEAQTSHVEIKDCGDGTPCGTVVWVDLKPTDSGKDDKNPDSALRDRPLVGIQLLSGFERDDEEWTSGEIYDPESGDTYRSNLKLKEDGTLKVQGCILFLCQTQIWTAL